MKYTEIRHNWNKKITAAGTLTALALVPYFGVAQQAQAAPWNNNDHYVDNRDDRNTITIDAVVTRDLNGDHDFEVRADNGRILRVNPIDREPRSLNAGDLVRLTGRMNNDRFVADTVRVMQQSGDTRGRRTLDGVVTRDLNGNRDFEFRADSGRIYRVNPVYDEPRNLSAGDRMHITGTINSNGRFVADTMQIISQGGHDGSNGHGGYGGYRNDATLTGTVIRDLEGNSFVIQADNNNQVIVEARQGEPIRLSNGDRVALRGNFRRGHFIADEVRITRNDDTTARGSDVDFPGRITSVLSDHRFTIQADNGHVYNVESRSDLPSSFSKGDYAYVQGVIMRNSDTVRAQDISILHDRNWHDQGNNDQQISFRGEIIDKTKSDQDSGALVVRANDGQTYTVRVSDLSQFKRGQQVHVSGILKDGVVTHSAVDKL